MNRRNETALRRRLGELRERMGSGGDEAGLAAGIAEQVVAQRRARSLSQQELAALCGTTQSAIARFESGARLPRIDTLLRISEALDCELVVELRPRTRTKGGRE
jgi:ribosome-binding protein aMBF1 (putative translation factor)